MNKDKPPSMIKRTQSKKDQSKQIQQPQEQSEASYRPGENEPGESVKVALRLRPFNALEMSRSDENCFKLMDGQNLQLVQKKQTRNFRFNYVLPEKASQQQLYDTIGINEFLESALDGYSVTVFAYGQTGSGKTHTMAGSEEKLSQQSKFTLDDKDGIIPRAVRNLWQRMAKRKEQYSLKASFSEIYNEQIRDLLNPASGVLHCRWNAANGFFVEDLLIVDCTTLDDMVAVLLEGMKNRKSGSHELNKDSSRSHSILTMYVISQVKSAGEIVKKYGKISFVDLAGSERLKESKSQGQMVKQTGNINKSLFTLGKVIKGLSDRKSKTPYIPYRDSKLTMLLMDSLGGTSKALMIACASPSGTYYEQTLSTLNYATRTMNIKNKPVVQMDPKDQIIYGLIRERELLRLQNQYLQEQIQKANNGIKIQLPDFFQDVKDHKDLPPLAKNSKQASQRPMSLPKPSKDKQQRNPGQSRNAGGQFRDVSLKKLVQEYEFELSRVEHQNQQLRNGRDIAQKNFHIVINDNNALQIKLDNLEQLFIKSSTGVKKNLNEEYMNSNLMAENKLIRDRIEQAEDEVFEFQEALRKGTSESSKEEVELKELKSINKNLAERIEFLQRRQRELIQAVQQQSSKVK